MKKKLSDITKEIWKEKDYSDEWRNGMIMPLYKKGDPSTTSNYRGVTFLCTAHNLHAAVLNHRIKTAIELKGRGRLGRKEGRSSPSLSI